jgi:hypothetical protein
MAGILSRRRKNLTIEASNFRLAWNLRADLRQEAGGSDCIVASHGR